MRNLIAFFAIAALATVLLWVCWPDPASDPAKVHPRLLALDEPFNTVDA